MRRETVLSLCLVAGSIAFGRAQAVSNPERQSDRAAEKAIGRLERDRRDAFIRGDADAVDRATAETYTTVSPSGVLADKAQMMKNIRARKTQGLSVTRRISRPASTVTPPC